MSASHRDKRKNNLTSINIANTAGAISWKTFGSTWTSKTFVPFTVWPKRLQAVFQSLPNTSEYSVRYNSDHTEVKVIDGNGNAVPFGQPGELCVRGHMTFMDYNGDAEKTREVCGPNRCFRTWDQFVLQAGGYANIVGRLKEMIIRGGENLCPREIEDFLNSRCSRDTCHQKIENRQFGNLKFIDFLWQEFQMNAWEKKFVRRRLESDLKRRTRFCRRMVVLILKSLMNFQEHSGNIEKFKFVEAVAEKLKAMMSE